jgi:hypothetical protein
MKVAIGHENQPRIWLWQGVGGEKLIGEPFAKDPNAPAVRAWVPISNGLEEIQRITL